MLVILGGLPGTGKTSIARELARRTGAVYLRIDTIEHALRGSWETGRAIDDAGYRIAYAIAGDNLRLGRTVIADSVNPLRLTRDPWRQVAQCAQVAAIEVEVRCSDEAEHRRRVEERVSDIPGFRLPSWAEVSAREYESWDGEHLVIDTATLSVEAGVAAILREMQV